MTVAAVDPKAVHTAAEWTYASPLISARFDPAGRLLVTTAEDSTIQRWDLSTGKPTQLKGHESWVRGIAFGPDDTLVTSGYDEQLIWWSLDDKTPAPKKKVKAHKGWIRALSASPDRRWIASGGNDNIVRLWNAASGELVREFIGHDKHIYSAMFHPSGEFLLTGDLAGQVIQWEATTGKQIRQLDGKSLHTYNGGQGVDYGGVRSLSLSPDGKLLACSGLHKASNPLGAINEPLVLLFDWDTGKLVRSNTAKGVRGIAWRTMFHPAGFMVAAIGGSGGGQLLFWNKDQDEPIHKLKLKNTAREMDLHPDGVQVATVHWDRRVRMHRLEAKAAK